MRCISLLLGLVLLSLTVSGDLSLVIPDDYKQSLQGNSVEFIVDVRNFGAETITFQLSLNGLTQDMSSTIQYTKKELASGESAQARIIITANSNTNINIYNLEIVGKPSLGPDAVTPITYNVAGCFNDGHCSNNDFCDGFEKCVDNNCQSGNPDPCNDNKACTIDNCDPITGCSYTSINCECPQGLDSECDDGDPCSLDTCDALFKCQYSFIPGPCDDGNICTINTQCVYGSGCVGDPLDCTSFDDSCNVGICTEPVGCITSPAPDSTSCDDGFWCYDGDQCLGGFCIGSIPKDCDDGFSCTSNVCDDDLDVCTNSNQDNRCNDGLWCNGIEACDPAQGSLPTGCYVSIETTCDDGLACTDDFCEEATDSCSSVNSFCACESGLDSECDDGWVCSINKCNPFKQCYIGGYRGGATCDDGKVYTVNDQCTYAGTCEGVGEDCSHLDTQCRLGVCTEPAGCGVDLTAKDGQSCDDGFYCTVNDQCQTGACTVSNPRNCDDGIFCTIDDCSNFINSCTYTLDHTRCNDNDVCNGIEACTYGSGCVINVPPPDCTAEACVISSCDPIFGCQFDYTNCDCPSGLDADCDDGNSCTDDVCVDFMCINTPDWSNTCNDFNWCTVNDRCDYGGNCISDPRDCDWMIDPPPDNQCQTSFCDDIAEMCLMDPVADGIICNDGFFCTVNDECVGGFCLGNPNLCDDLVGCTDDVCNEAFNVCNNNVNNANCDDGLVCNGAETCDFLLDCQPGGALLCNDGNVCNGVETCDDVFGCQNAPPLICSDNNVCNGIEICDPIAGCQLGFPLNCDDGNPCNGVETCDPIFGCQAGAPLVCSNNDVCDGVETCVNGLGCDNPPNLNCDDGIPCTDNLCDAASGCWFDSSTCDCPLGTDGECDDGNPCTTNTCNALKQCVTVNNNFACDDGLFCTQTDTCSGGVCVGANPPDCSWVLSEPQCEDPVCVEGAGSYVCVASPKVDGTSCNDGLWCEISESCQGGMCIGAPRSCSDGISCTSDSCNEGTDSCNYFANDAFCNDGDVCDGEESCVYGTGCVPGTPLSCDNGDPCDGVESCDSVFGCQSGVPLSCSDGDPCTGVETCVVGAGCDNPPDLVCDDGIPCTTNLCVAGFGCAFDSSPCGCPGGTDGECDDGNPCTTNTCNALKQCVTVNNNLPCDDGLFCTQTDTCSGGVCVGANPPDCSGVISVPGCEEGLCVEGGSNYFCLASPLADGTACNDGLWCYTGDVCQGGMCLGSPRDCSDGFACTSDSCNDFSDSCVNSPVDALCSDGNVCDGIETCELGAGCVEAILPLTCDNGLWCDGVESCHPSLGCQPGVPPSCNDGLWCNGVESCNEGTDSCNSGSPPSCDDGNACNGVESCNEGTDSCNSGTPPNCVDGVACSVDSCIPASGCFNDFSECGCPSGLASECSPDSNPCTDTECQNFLCVHVNDDSNSCSDGNWCTPTDSCVSGSCIGSGTRNCNDGIACTVDTCNSGTSSCDNTPNDNLCSPDTICGNYYCSAVSGCQVSYTPSFVECRPSAGVCDPAEKCTGSSATCPVDSKSTSTCRTATLPCDVAEVCDGVNNNCPTDAVRLSSYTCRSSAGICDLPETCDGVSKTCPTNTYKSSGTSCRASQGSCDPAEYCSGSSATCPGDAKSTSLCRSATLPCDVPEYCNGVINNCPSDSVRSNTYTCRALQGSCDIADTCDGFSKTCPADQKSTALCRAASGECDVAEYCDGSSNTCPPDTGSSGNLCNSGIYACTSVENSSTGYNNGGYGYETQGYCENGACTRSGTGRNPDVYSSACECERSGTQSSCSNGETDCWDSSTAECCGDGVNDNWCDGVSYSGCVSGTYRTDADTYSQICECGYSGTQSTCNVNGERGCWTGSRCCGDDAGEDFCLTGYSACYNAVYYADGDVSSYVCECGVAGTQGTCDYDYEVGCWDTITGTCCGDDPDEETLCIYGGDCECVMIPI